MEGHQSVRHIGQIAIEHQGQGLAVEARQQAVGIVASDHPAVIDDGDLVAELLGLFQVVRRQQHGGAGAVQLAHVGPELLAQRSEEHTSELQSLMRISYAVFCLKKKKKKITSKRII